ncbi:MAG: hypothetical protein WB561_17455 [Terracidiphilus sp.]
MKIWKIYVVGFSVGFACSAGLPLLIYVAVLGGAANVNVAGWLTHLR